MNRDDLISRQAALDAVFNNAEAPDKAFQAIRELPSVQPEPQWIPVSEGLPDEEVNVLVTRRFLGTKHTGGGWNAHIPPSTYVEIANRLDDTWYSDSDEYKVAPSRHTDPVAWMPLPEPYKEAEE